MFSAILTVGWRGFGFDRGLIPELRVGLISIAWCRGGLWCRLDQWRLQLQRGRDALRSAVP